MLEANTDEERFTWESVGSEISRDGTQIEPESSVLAPLSIPQTLYASALKNRDLFLGVTAFVGTSYSLEAVIPASALPIVSWLGMTALVSAVVSGEALYAKQSVATKVVDQIKPFVVVFLPFVLTGLTCAPMILKNADVDEGIKHGIANLIGAVCAVTGLMSIVPASEQTLEIVHLLVTLAGFMALGTYNDISSDKINESLVLPLSGGLAVLMAMGTTFVQGVFCGDERLSGLYKQNPPSCFFAHSTGSSQSGGITDSLLDANMSPNV